MSLNKNRFDRIVAELREQGLKVTVCGALDEAWYIKDNGPFSSYIASGTELLELKSANRLNIHGIKSLAYYNDEDQSPLERL